MRALKIKDPISHFWSRVNKNGPLHPVLKTRCWLWTGPAHDRNTNSYGEAWFEGKSIGAHRVAYFIHFGVWPKNSACHKCDVRLCCRPDHLFDGTYRENKEDQLEKGRGTHGEKNGRAKLNENQVRAIRKQYTTGNFTLQDLGQKYKVSFRTIHYVVSGKTWSYLG